MLYNWFRLFKRGVSLTDLSIDNQDDSVTSLSNLLNTEYFYIAQSYPFNNFFYWSNVANANSATMKIEYYSGNNNWVQAVDVIDGTNAFSKSGVVQFSPNRNSQWTVVNDTSDNNSPPELQGKNIYNQYWLRISFDNNLSALTSFNKISYAFTSTQQLNKLDVEINGFYDSFQVGKSDWIKEIITASELVIRKMRSMNIVVNQAQVLRLEDVSLATDFRALELIYSNLGKSYEDRKKEAQDNFKMILEAASTFTIDKNDNALIDKNEQPNSNNSWLKR